MEIQPYKYSYNGNRTYLYKISDNSALDIESIFSISSQFQLTFYFAGAKEASVFIDGSTQELNVNRGGTAMEAYSQTWQYSRTVTIPGISEKTKRMDIRVIWDNCILELFANEGLGASTNLDFCPRRLEMISIRMNGQESMESIAVYSMKNAMEFTSESCKHTDF
jgi:sucrose-6-phosphate hydrolase SacC (GH32 family)